MGVLDISLDSCACGSVAIHLSKKSLAKDVFMFSIFPVVSIYTFRRYCCVCYIIPLPQSGSCPAKVKYALPINYCCKIW